MQVFTLKSLEFAWGRKKNPDNSINGFEHELGVFSSVERAEKMIRDYGAHEGSGCILGFLLFEKTLDDDLREHGPCYYQAVRSYLPDGSLLCYSPYDSECGTEYFGRNPETIRFRRGDLVFQWCGDAAVPRLVGGTPPTKADWRRIWGRAREKGCRWGGWDSSDDCYYVYGYGKVHDHPLSWSVFPFSGTMSKRNRARLERTKAWYADGCPGA